MSEHVERRVAEVVRRAGELLASVADLLEYCHRRPRTVTLGMYLGDGRDRPPLPATLTQEETALSDPTTPDPGTPDNQKVFGTYRADQEFTVFLSPKDEDGHEDNLAGTVAWTVDQTDKATIAPSADGLSCLVTLLGVQTADGSPLTIVASALAEAGHPLTSTAFVTVTPELVRSLNLVLGPGTDRAPLPPPPPPETPVPADPTTPPQTTPPAPE